MFLQWKTARLAFETGCADGGEETSQFDLLWAIVGHFFSPSSGQPVSPWALFYEVTNVPILEFVPISGAAGWQVGNPSALALTAVIASLEIFALTDMATIRAKSVAMTAYLEELLLRPPSANSHYMEHLPYRIITPSNPEERGAQLSVRLEAGLLEGVMGYLEDAGVIVDERRPDVIRVAPAPLFNTFKEVWDFVTIFTWACSETQAGVGRGGEEAAALKGQDRKGWAEIK